MRATKRHPCPLCGREKYCVVLGGGRLMLCTKVEAGSLRPSRDGSGWLHVLQDDPNRRPLVRSVSIESPPPDLTAIVERACAATSTRWLRLEAARLGLPLAEGAEALRRLDAHRALYDPEPILRLAPRSIEDAKRLRYQCRCWLRRTGVLGIPMASRGRVVGVRLRLPDGEKRSLLGGREGAFLPDGIEPEAPLWIVEGPTDCAALLTIGLSAIGRPSATGGGDVVVELVLDLRPRPPSVVIVADHDTKHDVGQRSAANLAVRLALLVPDVRVVLPPLDAKDARAAVVRGAGRSDFEATAAQVEPVHVELRRATP